MSDLPIINHGDEWDGTAARVGVSVNDRWRYKVRIWGEVDQDDDSIENIKAVAKVALERLEPFRDFFAMDDDFGMAIHFFQEVASEGLNAQAIRAEFHEGLSAMYDWGDRERVVIS